MAINRALVDDQNGLGDQNIRLAPEAASLLATATNGDLRSALNGLELAAKSTDPTDGVIELTLPIIEECVQKKGLQSR